MTPRIGSLCSGVGGLDLGLIAAVGGSVAWHVECDPNPSKVLDARFPGVPNYGDVTTTDWTTVDPVDWITAGYPCQPFSAAGKRQGEADDRHLWPAVAAAVRVLRPGRVLLENVAGHLSLGFGQVLGDLAALGYDATWLCLRAADAGAPHGRARVFVVATDTASNPGRERDGDDLPAEWTQPLRCAAADAGGEAIRLRAGLRESEPGRVGWRRPDDDPAPAVPDTTGDGRDEGRAEPAGVIRRLDAAQRGHGSVADSERGGRAGWTPDARRGEVERTSPTGGGEGVDSVGWGPYGPAIRRWEHVTMRPAPRPTERGGRGGERLSPHFVEWMMGLPAGWVTDVRLTRNAQLKALGNGVVPQQAALAVRTLLATAGAVAA